MNVRTIGAITLAALSITIAGCGGVRSRVINGHTMTFDGARETAQLWVDGVAVRVRYDQVDGAYRAPGCDFGPAASLESLAEQVASTSPEVCQPLEPAPAE